jgi:hypothetical protein
MALRHTIGDFAGGNVSVKNCVMVLSLAVPLLSQLAGCANSPASKMHDIPASLRVPAAEVLIQRAQATGVQIYRCREDNSDAARFAWQLKAPEADLFDGAGNKIGKHYAGPTWEANDGSKVAAEVAARVDSPDPSGIPWLLLRAKSTSGSGLFGSVRFIQRLHTVGGSAPSDGCNQASAGSETRTAYSAEYWFYADKR